MRIVRGSCALATFLLFVVSCGGSDNGDKAGAVATSDGASADTAVAVADIGAAADSVAADSTSSVDTASVDLSGSCPGGAGCPCTGNDGCDLAICLETAKGKVCAAACTESTSCQPGQVCAEVAVAGGDTQTVCVDRGAHWCDPCKSSAACGGPGIAGAKCVVRGPQGAFCGLACGAGEPACPGQSTCQDVVDVQGNPTKQCMPQGQGQCACSPLAVAKELATTCSAGASTTSACEGVRVCLADGKQGAPAGGGLSDCIGTAPEVEACNGLDDDCDGATDEQSLCDDGNPCTIDACEAGVCSSKVTDGICDDGDLCTDKDNCSTGSCQGEVKTCDDGQICTQDSCDPVNGCVNAPTIGACDDGDSCTADDACNAGACTGKAKSCDDGNACTVDGCDSTTGNCTVQPAPGPCDDGNPCTAGDLCQPQKPGGELICQAGPPTQCDDGNPCTKDNCDPQVGCLATVDPSASVPCYTGPAGTKGVGTCVGGQQNCLVSGGLGPCQGEVTPVAAETCDGKDETCDGQTDENCTGGGPPVVVWTLGSTVLNGSTGSTSLRGFVGGTVGGDAVKAGKTGVKFGFYAWLSAWLK